MNAEQKLSTIHLHNTEHQTEDGTKAAVPLSLSSSCGCLWAVPQGVADPQSPAQPPAGSQAAPG